MTKRLPGQNCKKRLFLKRRQPWVMLQCARWPKYAWRWIKMLAQTKENRAIVINLMHPITKEKTTKLHANFFDENKKDGILTSSCEHGINLFQ